MARYIITGATGFLGERLVEKLYNDGHELFCLLNPISLNQLKFSEVAARSFRGNPESPGFADWLLKAKADALIHLAAVYPDLNNVHSISQAVEVNIQFGTLILNHLKIIGQQLAVVNIGTGWQHFRGQQYEPVDLYAATKQAFEDILYYYCSSEGFKAISLHFFDTYGENDKRNKLLNLLLRSEPEDTLELTFGEQTMSLIHIEDIVSAILTAIEILNTKKPGYFEKFALNSKDKLKVRALVNLICTAGVKSNVKFGAKPYRQREIMNPEIPLQDLPGWNQSRKLADYINEIACKNRAK